MAEPHPDQPSEARWPALATLVTAWLCPATSARRTLHASLWSAYAMHLLAAVLVFLLIVLLAAFDIGKPPAKILMLMRQGMGANLSAVLLRAVSIALVVESFFVIAALLLTAWGAGDERLRSSWAHAFRVVWLQTSHALPAVLLVGALTIYYDQAEQAYYRTEPPYPQVPAKPRPDKNTRNTQQQVQYAVAVIEYQIAAMHYSRVYREWQRHSPFVVKYGPGMIVSAGTACGLWILWAMIRAVGIRRPIPAIPRPPTCEFCGYNLTATPIESRCPECGRPVLESLGPGARPGTPWDLRFASSTCRAWWRCGVDAVLRPTSIGRRIRVCDQSQDHRVFFALHLPIIFLLATITALGCLLLYRYASDYDPNYIRIPEVAAILPPLFGGLSVLTAAVLAGLAAGLVGLVFTFRNRRNLLPASIRSACYLATYMAVWTAFAAILAVIACLAVKLNLLLPVANQMRTYQEPLAWWLWTLSHLPWFAGYVILVWKGTTGAQYANK